MKSNEMRHKWSRIIILNKDNTIKSIYKLDEKDRLVERPKRQKKRNFSKMFPELTYHLNKTNSNSSNSNKEDDNDDINNAFYGFKEEGNTFIDICSRKVKKIQKQNEEEKVDILKLSNNFAFNLYDINYSNNNSIGGDNNNVVIEKDNINNLNNNLNANLNTNIIPNMMMKIDIGSLSVLERTQEVEMNVQDLYKITSLLN